MAVNSDNSRTTDSCKKNKYYTTIIVNREQGKLPDNINPTPVQKEIYRSKLKFHLSRGRKNTSTRQPNSPWDEKHMPLSESYRTQGSSGTKHGLEVNLDNKNQVRPGIIPST